jgi:hypothetical protein
MENMMKTLWATIAMMAVTTALIFGAPFLFRQELKVVPVSIEVSPPPPGTREPTTGGDSTKVAPAAPSIPERILDATVVNVQNLFWALVQAFLIGRYIKKGRE